MNITKFLRTAFFIEQQLPVAASVLGICRPSVINQKYNVGWFLPKRFVHLCRAFSLHIISRKHSNEFLLIFFIQNDLHNERKSKIKYIQ